MEKDIRVLVVDDDPDIRFATARILKNAGYETLQAETGEQCLRVLRNNNIDLVLLDVVLPDFNGYEICRDIKSDEDLSDVFVIMISGKRTSADEQSKGLEIGADGYLKRPITKRELLAWLQALVRIIKAEREKEQLIYKLEATTESLRKSEQDLLKSKQKAENANKSKSQFLANMSHEIRTPLNGVQGMLQLLDATPLNEEQQEYVSLASSSTKRLTKLLSDILDLSKIEAGKIHMREEKFQPEEILQYLEDILDQSNKENGNELFVNIESNVPKNLIGDSTRLTQILFNLVGNATKYTKQGRIDILVSLIPDLNKNKCRILFIIQDTGEGIADEKLDQVFETFTQANQSESVYSRENEGVGLGLPLVKYLVNLMGGNIAIDSLVGQGTTVYASLPFAIAEDSIEQNHTSKEAVPEVEGKGKLEGYKILLADDDSITCLVVKRLLEKQGLEVHLVGDGQEAWKAAEKYEFDCILMDIQMPIMDGVEATQKIRSSHLSSRNVPIIALTAYAMSGDKEKFLEAGMDDYVSKPVGKLKLLEVINRNLG